MALQERTVIESERKMLKRLDSRQKRVPIRGNSDGANVHFWLHSGEDGRVGYIEIVHTVMIALSPVAT